MTDDLIRRQAAIDAVVAWTVEDRPDIEMPTDLVRRIDALSSAQPERKRGEWIDEPVYKQTMDGKTWDGFTYCSECKEMHEYGYRSNYCPDCGAQMNERRE